jgi:hypothetical protein
MAAPLLDAISAVRVLIAAAPGLIRNKPLQRNETQDMREACVPLGE